MSQTVWKNSLILLLAIACILGHLLTPACHHWIHDFFFKFTYLPIVLMSIWYGLRPSLLLTLLFSVVYLYHIIFQLSGHDGHDSSPMLELVLYFLVCIVTGLLSDRQRKQNALLNGAYGALREKTEALVAFEKQVIENEKLRVMGEMAASIAHEVRTPLSALQGAVEVVVSEGSDSATRKKFSKMVYQEIERINRVVGNFLKLGQSNSITEAELKLQECLQDMAELMSAMLRKHGVSLELKVGAEIRLRCSEDGLKQILINLIMNAVQAMADKAGRLCISAKVDHEICKVSVEDNGPGIPLEEQSQIFTAFFSKKAGGSGLGLYISSNLATSMGGDLQLQESKAGKTVFCISLPGRESL